VVTIGETDLMTGLARLHAVQDGPPDAPVVVLGPSLGTDVGMFDAQVPALAGDHRVVRFDLRGHGGSQLVAGPCTVADLAGDVLGLMDDLGIMRFSYAGVSIGGAIGLELALTVPERVERLAVVASAAQFPDPGSYAERAHRVRAQGTSFLLPSRTGTWFTAAFAAARPDETGRLLAMLRATPAEGYAACCDAIAAFDVRDRLDRIVAPTLVVAGAEDPAVTPDTARLIADLVPDARFVVVPGAAHLPGVENPSAINVALCRHFAV
jgi:3-oxoadipate enol-lactonase